MKVLITGATGFVGSHLTKKLIELGHEVRILSRKGEVSTLFKDLRPEVFIGEITDKNCLLLATKGIHTVFHLAGLIAYKKSLAPQMVSTNIGGTANVIDACIESKCERLVHMSSVAAVGASFDGKTILNEQSQFNLHELELGYFETKLKAELLVLNAVKAKNLNAVVVNPSNIYGPGDTLKGSRNTQLLVARGKFPFYTSGGVSVIHIDDVVEGICKAWQVGKNGERYILSGDNITIKNLFELIAEAAGVRAPKIYLPNSILLNLSKITTYLEKHGRKGIIDAERVWSSILFHWFDNSKARKELGLNPRPAREAICDSIRWAKENNQL